MQKFAFHVYITYL